METFTQADADALVHAYHESKIDDECEIVVMPNGIRQGVLHLPCVSSVIAAALIAEAKRVLDSACGRAYVDSVRAAAMIWPAQQGCPARGFIKLKKITECRRTWIEGRIARHRMTALLLKRPCRKLKGLKRLLAKVIEPLLESIETLQWLQAIAAGDPCTAH